MPNITELVLIMAIVVIVFGVGRLSHFASAVGKMRVNFRKGYDGPETIDVTQKQEKKLFEDERKPGKFENEIEDARVEEPGAPQI